MTAKTSRTRQGLEAGRRSLVEAAIAETYRGREDPVLAAHHEHLSRFYGGLAADSFAASGAAADIQHGEVMPTGDTNKALGLRDTLRTPDMPAIDASIARTDLLLTESLDGAGGSVLGSTVSSVSAPDPAQSAARNFGSRKMRNHGDR